MKFKIAYIVIASALFPAFTGRAQCDCKEDFAIKAVADIGLGKGMDVDGVFPDMTTKSSSHNFELDFGWTFWKQDMNYLEANIGIGYGCTYLKANAPGLDYHYSAAADADMDGDTYIRYYDVKDLHQKIQVESVTLPIYLKYRYRFSKVFSLHAVAGVRLRFNTSSKVSECTGKADSYGVYPQYDNLLIDASYMNMFGETSLDQDRVLAPAVNKCTTSILAGIGADFDICGPLAGSLSLNYERGLKDMFKKGVRDLSGIDAMTAPVTYTVAEGQTVRPLSSYLTRSKISRFSLSVALIYRF